MANIEKITSALDNIDDMLDTLNALRNDIDVQHNPAEALAALPQIRNRLHQMETLVIDYARTYGETWTTVGAAYSMSRQAAHERFTMDNYRAPNPL